MVYFEIDKYVGLNKRVQGAHCLETNLKGKRMGPLQFCLHGILWTYINNRQEEFQNFHEENLKYSRWQFWEILKRN